MNSPLYKVRTYLKDLFFSFFSGLFFMLIIALSQDLIAPEKILTLLGH